LSGIKKKQEGASKEDIEQLSKFKFQRTETNEKLAGNTQGAAGGIMTECETDSPIEHVLSEEDAVWCSFLLCVAWPFSSFPSYSFCFVCLFQYISKRNTCLFQTLALLYAIAQNRVFNTFPDWRMHFVFILVWFPSISSFLALLFNLTLRWKEFWQSGSRKWEIILMRSIICFRKTDCTLLCC